MKTKCPVCNSCFEVIWVANRRFFSCWLCKKTYDLVDKKFKEVAEIVTETDSKTNAKYVLKVYYKE